MSKIHTTIGLYPNGDFKINGVLPEHLSEHIEYNKTWRFGRALFVDDKCIYPGSVSAREIKEFEERIKNNPKFKLDKCTMPYQ